MKTDKMFEIEKRMNKPIDEFLKEQYYVCGKSMIEIAKSLGISRSCVSSWFKKLKIPVRDLSHAQTIIQSKKQKCSGSMIKNLYLKQGLSQQKIADKVGLNQGTISKILIKMDVRPRRSITRNAIPSNKKNISKEKLKELYLKKNISTHKIAKLVGVKQSTVWKWLKKYGIKRRDLSQAQFRFHGKEIIRPSKKELFQWYVVEKKSEPQIAKLLGVDVGTISNWLKEYEIDRRNQMEARFISLGKEIKKPSKFQLYGWYVQEKQSTVEIARKLGVSVTFILNWLNKYNIKIRTGSEANFNVYGKDIKKPTKKQFRKWYVIKKISATEISKKIGTAKSTSLNWLRECGIIRRKTRDATIVHYEKHPETIEKIRKKRLDQVFPVKDTKIEQLMQSELKSRGINFDTHVPAEKICQPDIVMLELKLVVQCDGDYWHANPKMYKNKKLTEQQTKIVEKDIRQDKILKSAGWVVLRFWECEINNNVSKCVDLIETAIKERAL